MKKLLFILLFFTCTAQAQISITAISLPENITTNATAFGPLDQTLTAGKLYLFVTGMTGASGYGTITSSTQTWDVVSQVGDATRRLAVYRCMPVSTVTLEDISLGSFGGSTGYFTALYEISNVKTTGTNGADAIVQAVSNTGTATANPSVTMAALTGGSNAVMALFTNSLNPFGGTVEAGWTEDFNSGYATPDNGSYIMHRVLTTDNTPTVTAASSDWAGIAIEFAVTGRRRIIID